MVSARPALAGDLMAPGATDQLLGLVLGFLSRIFGHP